MALHPFAIAAFVMLAVFAVVVFRSNTDLPGFIGSMNSVGAQPTGIAVLMIGCTMLVICKTYQLDSTIAGGIVGCGINMLTNQFSKHPPTNPDDIKGAAQEAASDKTAPKE